jgi:hypothetical protein
VQIEREVTPAPASEDDTPTVFDVLRDVPLDRLDALLQRFRGRVPVPDLREALAHRIGAAPWEDVPSLHALYRAHFG